MSRNSVARPIVIAVQIFMVCRGVERSELKLNTMKQGAEEQAADFRRDPDERQRDHHADGRLAVRSGNDR